MWSQEEQLYGCTVKVCFFESEGLEKIDDFVERTFPMLENKKSVKLIYTEEDRRNFKFGDIVAQPDAVLSQGDHLLCLEYKSAQKRKHHPNKWKHEIKLKDMLQAIINAIQVSSREEKCTVTLLRYTNVLYMLVPSENLCEMILKDAKVALELYNKGKYIASSDLAKTLEPKIQKMYPMETKGSRKGRRLHEVMLRR